MKSDTNLRMGLGFRSVIFIFGLAMATTFATAVSAQDATEMRLISAHADCNGAGVTQLTVTIDGQTFTPDAATTQGCICGTTALNVAYTDPTELSGIDTTPACGANIIEIDHDPKNGNLYIGSLGIEYDYPGGTTRVTLFGNLDDPEACQAGSGFMDGPFEVGPPDQDGDGIPDCIDPDRDGDGVDNVDDNCPDKPNPGQEDSNGNGVGDACDFIVHAVPLDPFDRLRRHDIMSGVPTTIKAACPNDACEGADWEIDFGDGSAVATGVVAPAPANIGAVNSGETYYYSVWGEHVYDCQDGDVFNATVTVSNGTVTESDIYRMVCRAKTLPVEVNAAIDEALWHMHRNQFRFDADVRGNESSGTIPMSRWDYPQTFGSVNPTVAAASINAMEANGYLETGPGDSPYTETVARGLRYLFSRLQTVQLSVQTVPAGRSDDPDTNGNGIGLQINEGNEPPYETGMPMDAIVATGTPGAVATTGSADVIGRTYGDIIQDMVDYYAWAQSDSTNHGGWRYSNWDNSSGTTDNSTNGWAAIGMVAAEDLFGATVPRWVKDKNEDSLEFTDNESDVSALDGMHGYTSTSPIWGPYGTSGAALVQMVMDDVPSTTDVAPDERWIRTENLFRRDFNAAATGNNFKNYYYAMFNFAKGMRTAVPEPVVIIGTEVGAADGGVGCGPNAACAAGGPAPLDWYNDPVDGLARTIVDYTIDTGPNIGGCPLLTASGSSSQSEHDTPWCAQILTQTLFQAGPVARADAAPNPGAIGQTINFDGSASFHQDPARSLVLYEWDFDNDGTFDFSDTEPDTASTTFPALGSFPVTLRVTDDNDPAFRATDVVLVEITIPPHAPTADADGPYLACINQPIDLDGSGSFDIDEGQSESGNPPFDTITAWEWDLDGDLQFDDASGEIVAETYTALGTFEVGLRVTDNTAAAFPSSGSPDLTDTDFTTVTVLPDDAPECVSTVECPAITIRPKSGKNQLVWEPVPGAASYDIYRSTEGPASGFSLIAQDHVTGFATYLDTGLTNGVTYYYYVVAKSAAGAELCTSDVADGTPVAERRRRR